jgi:hypothetical protein
MCVNQCVEVGYWNIKGAVPLRGVFLRQPLMLLPLALVPGSRLVVPQLVPPKKEVICD